VTGVSVIICAYTERRWDDLVAATDSLRRQTTAPGEVLVVIDGNAELLDRAKVELEGVTVLANCETPGLSGARNTGLRAARGEIVAFLDDDAVAAPDWIEHLVSPYAEPSVLGVGGRIEPWWAHGRPRWFPGEFDWVVGCTYVGLPSETAPLRNLIGANMSARRAVLQGTGGFRTELGRVGAGTSGTEETELCIRASQRWPAGRWIYEPSAGVQHRVPGDRANVRYFLKRCYGEGRSKAQVVSAVGGRDGLSSERAYVARTLLAGMLRHALETVRDPAGAARALAIVAGLAATTAGFVRGRIAERVQRGGAA
jgi:hypothetical protein